MVKGPVEAEPKQLVPLGEESEKTGGPQEPAQWAEGHSEAQQAPTPEEPMARNGENLPLAEEEPPKALTPPSVEEGVSTVGTCMRRLHPSCSRAFRVLASHLITLIIDAFVVTLEECIQGKPVVRMLSDGAVSHHCS